MITIIYRMMGGFVGTGSTFLARLRWQVAIAAAFAFVASSMDLCPHGVDVVFFGTFAGAFLGRMIPHGFAFDQSKWQNTAWMSLIGLARTLLLFGTVSYFAPQFIWLSLFGLLQGPSYLIGEKFLDGKDSGFYFFANPVTLSQTTDGWMLCTSKPPEVFAKGRTEWAELMVGFACYELPFWLMFLI